MSDYLDQRRRLAEEFILKMDPATFARTDPGELVEQAVSQFDIEVPKLDQENRKTQSSKTQIDARSLPHRPVIDRGKPLPIPAVTIFFRVPFSGDGALFNRFPNKFTHNRPTAQIDGNELILDYTSHLADQEPDPSRDKIEQKFRDELNQIQRWLKWIREDVDEYRGTLTQLLRSTVEKRRIDDQKLSAALQAFGISESVQEEHDGTTDSPQALTYVEWCDRVLACLIEEEGKSSTTRYMGVEFDALAEALFSRSVRSNTPEVDALVQAISELMQLGFLKEGATKRFHKSTPTGRAHARDPKPFGESIRNTVLDEKESRLVRVVNERSHRPGEVYASTELVEVTELEWADQDELWIVGKRLEQEYGFLADDPHLVRGARFRSTYRGLLWGSQPEQETALEESAGSTENSGDADTAHVFISYVRQDAGDVDRLRSELEHAGVRVWIDRENIGAGERWKAAIRRAIRDGAFFIACFSANYHARTRTYMNEELTIAIEELRLRPTDRAWFIPVLLTVCAVPDRSIGAGETLRALQQVRLYEGWDRGIERILKAVRSQHSS